MSNFRVERGIIKSKVTRAQTYLDSLDQNNLSDLDFAQIKSRFKKVENCLDEFETVQMKILLAENTSEDADLTNCPELREFEELYYSVTARYTTLLELKEQRDSESGSMRAAHSAQLNNNISNMSRYKLPPIKLPSFEGKYQDWSEYKDAFLAIVDSDQSLTASQKFYYLRSTLGKEVLEVIKSLEITGDNYNVAWELLQERYENKGLLIHNHIKSIVEYPNLQCESYK